MAAGRESRAEVSRSSRERLRDVLRDELDEVRVRLEEAALRADAHLLTGNPEGATEALADQRRLLADLEERLDAAVADALVEREAESVVADAVARLGPAPVCAPSDAAGTPRGSAASEPSGGDGTGGAEEQPPGQRPSRAPVAAAGGQLPSMLGAIMTIVAAAVLALGSWTGMEPDLAARAGSGVVGADEDRVAALTAGGGDVADPLAAAADLRSQGQRDLWSGSSGALPTSPSTDTDVRVDGPRFDGLPLVTSSDLGSVRPLGVREIVDGLLAGAPVTDLADDVGEREGRDRGPVDEAVGSAADEVTDALTTDDESDEGEESAPEGTRDTARETLEEAEDDLRQGSGRTSPVPESGTESDELVSEDDPVPVDDGL